MTVVNVQKVASLKRLLATKAEQDMIDFIIPHILYFSTESILALVKQSFAQCIQDLQGKHYQFLINPDKWGSEHWLLTEVLQDKPHESVLCNLLNLEKGEHHIILVDDAIYSGTNIMSQIDNATYDLAQKLGVAQKDLHEQGYDFYFHIVVALSSGASLPGGVVHDSRFGGHSTTIHYQVLLPRMLELFPDFGPDDWRVWNRLNHVVLPKMSKQPDLVEESCAESTYPEYNNTLVFLQHKIPNQFGSVPALIPLITDIKIERTVIEQSQKVSPIAQMMHEPSVV